MSFSLAVPRAQLFTRGMNAAISRGLRTTKPLHLSGGLRKEVSHWLFLETASYFGEISDIPEFP